MNLSESQKKLLEARLTGKKKNDSVSNECPTITPAPTDAPLVLSFGQKALWSINAAHGDSDLYNIIHCYLVEKNDDLVKTSPIDLHLFERSASYVVGRHALLHSRFDSCLEEVVYSPQNSESFQLETIICEKNAQCSPEKILDRIKQRAQQEAKVTFDLSEKPAFRLLHISEQGDSQNFILMLVAHHIIFDMWSIGVFWDELFTTYRQLKNNEAALLPAIASTYQDYVYWQKKYLLSNEGNQQADYWKKFLAGVPNPARIPFETKVKSQNYGQGALLFSGIPPKITTKLKQVAAQNNVSLFMILILAQQLLISHLSGERDVTLGVPVTNRRFPELNSIIGYFLNMLPMRLVVSKNLNLQDALDHTRLAVIDALQNRDIPFDQIVGASNPPRNAREHPLFTNLLVFQQELEAEPEVKLEGHKFKRLYIDPQNAKFDFTLFVTERSNNTEPTRRSENQLDLITEYRTDLFSESAASRFLACFKTLLESIGNQANKDLKDCLVSDLRFLPESEEQLIHRQSTAPAELNLNGKTITDRILSHAETTPSAIALSDETRNLDYSELKQYSNHLAHYLIDSGVKVGDRVALFMDRSVEAIIAIVAIHRAGATYVPIKTDSPRERVKAILETCQIEYLLYHETETDLAEVLPLKAIQYNAINEPIDTNRDQVNFSHYSQPAYILHTSGSSGGPKGVNIGHDNLAFSTLSREDYYSDQPEKFLLVPDISFDSAVAGIFWSLATGNELIILPTGLEQDITQVCKLIAKHQITHALCLPSIYEMILSYGDHTMLRSLKTVIVAGEACNYRLVKTHYQTLPHCQLVNEYGPTEGTVWCSAHELSLEEGFAPIGQAIPGYGVYILDSSGNLLPSGSIGEIVICGPGVARGYVNNKADTDQHFFESATLGRTLTQNSEPIRCYRTGDLGRYHENGLLEFLGRKDQQVKVRGNRVELEEIENCMLLRQEVRQSKVIVVSEPDRTLILDQVLQLYEELDPLLYESVFDGLLHLDGSIDEANVKTQIDCLTRDQLIRLQKEVANQTNHQPQHKGHLTSKLILFVCFENEDFHADHPSNEALVSHLKGHLPDYMIPSHIISLPSLPTLPNGKINLLQLEEEAVAEIEFTNNSDVVSPRTDVEQTLTEIWSTTLSIDFDQLSIYDNFFELGGDSIASIHIIARARRAGIVLETLNFLDHPTIAELALIAKSETAEEHSIVTTATVAELTPIQHWFLELDLADPHHWNHGFICSLRASQLIPQVRQALQSWFNHHEMLRAGFKFLDKAVGQLTINAPLNDDEVPISLHVLDDSQCTKTQLQTAMSEAHSNIEFNNTPLCNIVLFIQGSAVQHIGIVAHHLIVDVVSWISLIDDLQTSLMNSIDPNSSQLPNRPKPYLTWVQSLSELQPNDEEREFWLTQPNYELAQVTKLSSITLPRGKAYATEGSVIKISKQFVSTLSIDLNKANQAFSTNTEELLVIALALAAFEINQSYHYPQSLRFGVEGHGRSAEYTQTCGWFTSYFPITINLDNRTVFPKESPHSPDLAEIIKAIKEQIRARPSNGSGFGSLYYLQDDLEFREQIKSLPDEQFLFSYLGDQSQASQGSDIFSKIEAYNSGSRSPRNARTHNLEIIAQLTEKNSVQVDWIFDSNIVCENHIEKLSSIHIDQFEKILEFCCVNTTGGATPSDFSFVEISQEALDELFD